MPRLIGLVCLAVAVAALLAACGGGSTTVVRTQAPTSSTGTGSHPAPRPTGTSSTPTTTTADTGTVTTSAAAAPMCTAATLKLGYLGGLGATGHGELGFSLTNTGARSCHTYGYPGVQFLARSGAKLPTHSTRTTHDFFGSVPARSLTVAPGSTVSFRLGTTHGAGSAAGCTTAAELQVIPPNDTHTLVVTIPNGAYECGTASVSPLATGTTAFR